MAKKVISLLCAVIAVLYCAYFIGTGFRKQSGVFLTDFSVSGDGKEAVVTAGSSASAGYTRKMKAHRQGERICLDFYSAFGGINGKIGAEETFVLQLDGDIRIIAVYTSENNYKDTYIKNSNGEWERTVQ